MLYLPDSLLYRRGEADGLRRELVQQRLLEAVVRIPHGLEFCTAAPGCLMILRRRDPACEQPVLLLDSGALRWHAGAPPRMEERDLARMVSALVQAREVEGLCRRVSTQELQDQACNLDPGRYMELADPAEYSVDPSEAADQASMPDLPRREVPRWQVDGLLKAFSGGRLVNLVGREGQDRWALVARVMAELPDLSCRVDMDLRGDRMFRMEDLPVPGQWRVVVVEGLERWAESGIVEEDALAFQAWTQRLLGADSGACILLVTEQPAFLLGAREQGPNVLPEQLLLNIQLVDLRTSARKVELSFWSRAISIVVVGLATDRPAPTIAVGMETSRAAAAGGRAAGVGAMIGSLLVHAGSPLVSPLIGLGAELTIFALKNVHLPPPLEEKYPSLGAWLDVGRDLVTSGLACIAHEKNRQTVSRQVGGFFEKHLSRRDLAEYLLGTNIILKGNRGFGASTAMMQAIREHAMLAHELRKGEDWSEFVDRFLLAAAWWQFLQILLVDKDRLIDNGDDTITEVQEDIGWLPGQWLRTGKDPAEQVAELFRSSDLRVMLPDLDLSGGKQAVLQRAFERWAKSGGT